MSNPGHGDPSMGNGNASTAGASQCQTPDRRPEPTGSASQDGAATAPPANLDGASPAATAPEAPYPLGWESV